MMQQVVTEKITGQSSNFALDLKPGDRIFFNGTQYVDVDKVNPNSLTGSQISTMRFTLTIKHRQLM